VVLDSSNSNTPACLARVTVPVLVTAATSDTQAHLPQAELACNSAIHVPDRMLAAIGGAEHDMSPARPDSGETRAAHLGVLVDWLSRRYLGPAGS
jgi:hypothetical protein